MGIFDQGCDLARDQYNHVVFFHDSLFLERTEWPYSGWSGPSSRARASYSTDIELQR